MASDPQHIGALQPDEADAIDQGSVEMIAGVDYIVVDNQKKPVKEHGRIF